MKKLFLIFFIVLLSTSYAKNDKFSTKDIYHMAELSLKDLNLYLLAKGYSFVEGNKNYSAFISHDETNRITKFFKQETLVYTFKNSNEYLNLTKQLRKDGFFETKSENVEQGIRIHYEFNQIMKEIDEFIEETNNDPWSPADNNSNNKLKKYKIEIFNGNGIIKYYFAVIKK
ncbi:MAG: hypothetical protein PF487_14215 [Bacteroidales bacterium]|jgi:hypothetical protein|nr:hypothetical protein [Bacteroidales bacterium]